MLKNLVAKIYSKICYNKNILLYCQIIKWDRGSCIYNYIFKLVILLNNILGLSMPASHNKNKILIDIL